MKTIILISLCLCLLATVINADKAHKPQGGKHLKSGHEERKEHKRHADVQPTNKDETGLKTHEKEKEEKAEQTSDTKPEQTETKPAGAGRKHRNNHHGKNKKGATNTEAHTGRSRKVQQTKANKQTGQKHGRKHGRGKQTTQ